MTWWVIHEEELFAAIQRAHDGEKPDLVMVELLANTVKRDTDEKDETDDE